jgi:hypothetical protein
MRAISSPKESATSWPNPRPGHRQDIGWTSIRQWRAKRAINWLDQLKLVKHSAPSNKLKRCCWQFAIKPIGSTELINHWLIFATSFSGPTGISI